eukprot:scaffold6051_cov28-Prasinocladus_malaysianus.AAC.2
MQARAVLGRLTMYSLIVQRSSQLQYRDRNRNNGSSFINSGQTHWSLRSPQSWWDGACLLAWPAGVVLPFTDSTSAIVQGQGQTKAQCIQVAKKRQMGCRRAYALYPSIRRHTRGIMMMSVREKEPPEKPRQGRETWRDERQRVRFIVLNNITCRRSVRSCLLTLPVSFMVAVAQCFLLHIESQAVVPPRRLLVGLSDDKRSATMANKIRREQGRWSNSW